MHDPLLGALYLPLDRQGLCVWFYGFLSYLLGFRAKNPKTKHKNPVYPEVSLLQGLGFGVLGFWGFGVWGLGFVVSGFGFGVWGLGPLLAK